MSPTPSSTRIRRPSPASRRHRIARRMRFFSSAGFVRFHRAFGTEPNIEPPSSHRNPVSRVWAVHAPRASRGMSAGSPSPAGGSNEARLQADDLAVDELETAKREDPRRGRPVRMHLEDRVVEIAALARSATVFIVVGLIVVIVVFRVTVPPASLGIPL